MTRILLLQVRIIPGGSLLSLGFFLFLLSIPDYSFQWILNPFEQGYDEATLLIPQPTGHTER